MLDLQTVNFTNSGNDFEIQHPVFFLLFYYNKLIKLEKTRTIKIHNSEDYQFDARTFHIQ